MGKRRGRTGPGGAVVSSLSENAGGKVTTNGRGGTQGSGGRRREDLELAELANPSGKGKGKKSNVGSSAASGAEGGASGSLSVPSAAPKWLGKSPSQMLREWCAKNNRKRPCFRKMKGSELHMCTIHQGTKDGKKAKGKAFDFVAGVGDHPGEEYAALNVLHQVERGKPLERLLAPEFRGVWLDLDRRYAQVQAESAQKAVMKEKRKAQAERRAKIEKSKESASINISAASRLLIEDAIVEHKASGSGSASIPEHVTMGSASVAPMDRVKQSLKNELVSMGFSEFDAIDAGQRFSDVTSALDYLCLNLDEAELPASFAPTADVEVVQFYSGSGKQPRGRIDPRMRDILTSLTCLSKHAAERSLRASDGELDRAIGLLYNTLTHNLLAEQYFFKLEDKDAKLALEERTTEGEAIAAIYGEDAAVGVGAMPAFDSKWAAVVHLEEGLPGIGFQHPVLVAFVDLDGLYPYSAPIVIIGADFSDSRNGTGKLSASYRRILMRAVAGEMVSLRGSCGAAGNHLGKAPTAAPVIRGVLSFLVGASDKELTSSAAAKEMRKAASQATNAAGGRKPAAPLQSQQKQQIPTALERTTKRRVERPKQVQALKPSLELSAMQELRARLPAYSARAEIIAKVRSNQVVVVSGATGSGKTTQIPQFLLEDAAKTGEVTSIVCTQPRRIAAMSVAARVAAERCQTVGESVGYQVKLNAKRSSRTRLLFCTTGVLLRRLQSDPQLDSLTHVLVDEVHERSVETDFLLLLLREIAARRSDLRIVLMSATLDAEKFSHYFSSALSSARRRVPVPVISIPGRVFPVDEFYLEDAVRMSQYRLIPGDRYARRSGTVAHKGKYGPEPPTDAVLPKPRNTATTAAGAEYVAMDDPRNEDEEEKDGEWDLTEAHKQYQESPGGAERVVKETIAIIDESIVNVDLIDLLVRRIDADGRKVRQNGAILVFLPGVAEISAVIRKLSSGSGSHYLWPLPLHSLLSPEEQNRVFSRPPKGKRKVVCSTNVAETSITVDDVTVVIDSLRAKEMRYDPLNRSSVLEECFISKAAAKQRAGRAGRVSKGTCYRLVRRYTFENRMAAQQIPEIQRVALEHLVLHMLSIIPDHQTQNDPHLFLGKAIDPPASRSIKTAIASLIDIGALQRQCDARGISSQRVDLTALGRHLTGLPVDARIGKLLIFGSLFSCVDATLTIAAAISERSPFYAPFDKREEARAARAPFVWGKSDLLTYVNAFNAWRDIRESRRGYAVENDFCSKNFLARKTLITISEGRKQLADALADAGFGLPGTAKSERGWERDAVVNQYSNNARVVKAVICAALYPNIARIDLPDATYHEVAAGTVANQYNSKDLRLRSKEGERLFLHPESVNFHEGNFETRWLAYFAKVKTTRLFVRDSTMVSPYAILLFGGEIAVQHKKGQMSVDNWVIFKAPARVAVLARELRRQLDGLLMRKFENSDMDLAEEGKAVNNAIIRLITTES